MLYNGRRPDVIEDQPTQDCVERPLRTFIDDSGVQLRPCEAALFRGTVRTRTYANRDSWFAHVVMICTQMFIPMRCCLHNTVHRITQAICLQMSLTLQLCLRTLLLIFGRPFVKRFALCYRSVVCPVCLSVTFVTVAKRLDGSR